MNNHMTQTAPKEDRQFGVDSRWSWVTAGFLSWYLSMALITPPCLGVVFYGIVQSFGVTREQAAWPLALSATLGNLSGPVMGYLCHRFSCHTMLLVCAVAAGGSLCACIFADSVLQLIFIYGVCLGLALSGVYVAVDVLVSQHFEKRRATACSLIFFFAGLDILFAPPLAELFRSTYGIRGTFLLLGGLTLNAFPAAIVLRSPPWMKHRNQSSVNNDDKSQDNVGHCFVIPNVLEAGISKEDSKATSLKSTSAGFINPSLSGSSTLSVQTASVEPFSSRLLIWKDVGRRRLAIVTEFLTISYLIIGLSFSMIVLGMMTFILVAVDIATDRGVPPFRAVFLINAFGIGDIVLRPLSGIVIDSGLLSLEAVMLFGFLLQAIAFELFAWLRAFPAMLACSVLVGVSNGARVSLRAPTLVKYFGIDLLPIRTGGVSFCVGIVILMRPFLVGYCRDQLGSYDLLLHIVAGGNIVFFVVWVVRYFIMRQNPQS